MPTVLSIRQGHELPRAVRRPVSLVAVLGYPAALLAQAQLARLGVDEPVPTAAYAVLVATTVAAILLVFRFQRSRGLSEPSTSPHDERQSLVLLRAVAMSYRIVGIVLLVLLLVAGWIDLTRGPVTIAFDLPMVLRILPSALILLAFLPSAVVAWSEPDLPDEA